MTDVETPVDALQDVEGHLREALKALGDVVRCFVGTEKCGKRWFTKGGHIVYRAWFDGSGGQVTCDLPKGHDGRHRPDVAADWRD